MNQYVQAKMNGVEPGDDAWPQQAKTRKKADPETARSAIDIDQIISTVTAVMTDEGQSTSNRLSAAKTLLDKSLSTLSTVDSTVRNEIDTMDEAGLMARMRAILDGRPELLEQLIGENARKRSA